MTKILILKAATYQYATILREYGPLVRFVDRGTDWGNPFNMDEESDREHVCDMFEKYAAWRLLVEPKWLEPLRGNHLVCYCAPKRCHAETLRRLANQ